VPERVRRCAHGLVGLRPLRRPDPGQRAHPAEGSRNDPTRPLPDRARALHSEAAAAEFTRYLDEPGHRAFAASRGGAWGWRAGVVAPTQAERMALADCDRRRQAYSAPCLTVHRDQHWVTH